MASVGIFYGSTTGVTEATHKKISDLIPCSEVFDISGNEDNLKNYDVLILERLLGDLETCKTIGNLSYLIYRL